MEKEVAKVFTADVLKEAAGHFGVDSSELKLLGDFENYAYEFEKDGRMYVLRITHSSHRNANLVKGELDWLNFLADGGVGVSRAIPSKNGRLVEKVESIDSYFLTCVFEKAKGRLVDPRDDNEWNGKLFQKWGQTIGKMHTLTRNYVPGDESIKRYQWYEDDLIGAEKYIPDSQPVVLEKQRGLLKWLHSLPVDKDNYGLIHTDVHQGNFFVDNGDITVFDFDDCAYNWFISDIAIPLFYALWPMAFEEVEKRKEFARNFMDNFWEGYYREHNLDPFWRKQIPGFLKQREMVIYTVFHKKLDMNTINERFRSRLMAVQRNIENDIPYVDIDFK